MAMPNVKNTRKRNKPIESTFERTHRMQTRSLDISSLEENQISAK
jgi:hypothetical protein